MKAADTCDFTGCQLNVEKTLALRRSWGLLARFYEDQMDLCARHYMEVLNWLYSKSEMAHISRMLDKGKVSGEESK